VRESYQVGLGLDLSLGQQGIEGERAENWLDVLPEKANVLRDYQRDILARGAVAIRKHRRVLFQAPTGAGKTHIIAALVAAAVEFGLRVLILATRTRLVRQLHERLESFGISHGVIAAALPGLTCWSRRVQVASVDTLYRRCVVDAKMPLPCADVVVFDEAHLALGASRQKILNSYPNAWQFGFTATPAKTSGAALSDQFDAMILGPTVSELIEAGMLVRPRIFAKPIVTAKELNAIRKDSKTGDYATGELSELLSRPKLIGDVVQNWLRIANGKRTIVFACDKAHGAQLVTEFRQAGIEAEQLTDDDDDDTREMAIARLESGATKVLVNYVGSFSDPAKSLTLAIAQKQQGADVILPASGSNLGIIAESTKNGFSVAAVDPEEAGKAGQEGVAFTMSMKVADSVRILFGEDWTGTLRGGTRNLTLAENVFEFDPFTVSSGTYDSRVPADVIKAAKEAYDGIVAGTITVPNPLAGQ